MVAMFDDEKVRSRLWIVVVPTALLVVLKVVGMLIGHDQLIGCLAAMVALTVLPSGAYFYLFRPMLQNAGMRGRLYDMLCLVPNGCAALMIPVSAVYEWRFPPENLAPFYVGWTVTIVLAALGMPLVLLALAVLARHHAN
jgi:hypothetical protein